jgi:hypothetical protein
MRATSLTIGGIVLVGGIVALLRPGPMTLFPSGSKWKEPVTVSAEHKRIYGIAAAALGFTIVIIGVRHKSAIARASSDSLDEPGA